MRATAPESENAGGVFSANARPLFTPFRQRELMNTGYFESGVAVLLRHACHLISLQTDYECVCDKFS